MEIVGVKIVSILMYGSLNLPEHSNLTISNVSLVVASTPKTPAEISKHPLILINQHATCRLMDVRISCENMLVGVKGTNSQVEMEFCFIYDCKEGFTVSDGATLRMSRCYAKFDRNHSCGGQALP